jgi:hypothetical protein
LRDERPRLRIPAMTVVVGVVCGDRKAGVIAADRSALLGGRILIDGRCHKITAVAGRFLVGFAGKHEQTEVILNETRAKAGLEQLDVVGFANRVALERNSLREHLLQRMGTEIKALLPPLDSAAQAVTAPQFGQAVFGLVQNVLAGCVLAADFMVLGCNASGQVSLYTVEGASFTPSPQDVIGFAAVGNGEAYAVVSLIDFLDSLGPERDLPAAVYGAYRAKWFAEAACGVGSETEIAVLQAGEEPVFLGHEDMEALRHIHETIARPTLTRQGRAEIDRLVQDRIVENRQAPS